MDDGRGLDFGAGGIGPKAFAIGGIDGVQDAFEVADVDDAVGDGAAPMLRRTPTLFRSTISTCRNALR
jgi:hypothetical protein